jgi:peptide/nickel transport system substrate-binding protein
MLQPSSDFWRRRLTRRRFLQYAAGAGAAGVALACRQETPQVQTPVPPEVRPPAPGQGGTIVFRDTGDPPSFDYYKTWGYRTVQNMALVYPRLLKMKVGPDVGPQDYDIAPELAVAMPEQPDATTYIFKLRPARWENRPPLNGRPLTAEDVVKNWDRFKAEHPNRALLVDVERVEATAPDTVRFVLARPLGPFLNHLAHPGMFYVMPYELFGTGQLEKDMWSAGPFLFGGFDVGVDTRFEYNPAYFVQGRPYASRIVIRSIPDYATFLSQVRARQVDATPSIFAGPISARDVPDLRRDLPNATFVGAPRGSNFWLGMDLRDPIFQDKRVRQAISMAIDRDGLVKIAVEGKWGLPYATLSKFYFDPKKNEFPNARYYHYNPQEARALLRAAGVERAGPYDLLSGRHAFAEQMEWAQFVQENLRAMGIETRIKELPYSEYYAQMVIGGRWTGGFGMASNIQAMDPNDTFSLLWTPGSPRLIAPGLEPLLRADNEMLDLLERQKRELDFNRRREIIRNLVNVMADRMYNVPLPSPVAYHLHQEDVVMPWIDSYGMEYVVEAWKRS